MKTYPVKDPLTVEEKQALEIKGSGRPLATLDQPVNGVVAVYSGEKRPPKKGEWFLSGAITEAYRALADMTTPYHIARLAVVETMTVEKITKMI